jgi:hypothetical protein
VVITIGIFFFFKYLKALNNTELGSHAQKLLRINAFIQLFSTKVLKKSGSIQGNSVNEAIEFISNFL